MGTLGEGEHTYRSVPHVVTVGSMGSGDSDYLPYLPSDRVQYNSPAFFFFFNEKHLSFTYHK